jgi:nucleoside-diphosphate-sugar epimerase
MSTMFIGHRRVQLRAVFFVVVVFVLILIFTASSTRLQDRINNFRNSHQSHENTNSPPSVPPSKEPSNGNPPTPIESSTFDKTYDDLQSPSPSSKPGLSTEKAKDPCYTDGLTDGGVVPAKVSGTKVLVTGGAGFIGSNLVDTLLKLGYKVRVFDNLYTGFIRNVPLTDDRVEFVLGDILDPEALAKAVEGVDYVYHLAAMSKVVPSVKNPEMARFCVEANALGTWNVLNAVREQGKIKKVIYAASSTYYGNKPPPHQEDMAPDFLTPYAASKYEGELQMQMFDRLFSVNTISTRFFMVYGPRQPSTGAYAIVTGVFAKQHADGKQLTIEGDGSHYRDFIHVQDIVNGLILSQQNPDLHGNVVNLGTGEAFSVQEVADLVSKEQKHVPERKNDLAGTLADTCRMKKLLNYKAQKEFIKEMSYMVDQTLAGNVFMQPWLKPMHALSAPHLLAPGTPVFKWPKTQDKLEELVTAVKKVGSETAATDKRISVIPFSLGSNETVIMEDLLLNTIFSLVRFGEVSSYIVAAADKEALETCIALNLPCYDAQSVSAPAILTELLKLGYDVHFAQIGNSYVTSVDKFFEKLVSSHPETGLFQAKGYGDAFVRSNDQSQTIAGQWSNEVRNVEVTTVFTPKTWPKAFKSYEFSAEPICETSSKAKPSSGKAQGSPVETPTTEKEQAFEDASHPTKAYKSELAPEATSTSIGKRDETPLDKKERRSAAVCNSSSFYASIGCSTENENVSAKNAESIKEALKVAGLWHLRECVDKLHCDKQQTVPERWVLAKPDLAEHGGMC